MSSVKGKICDGENVKAAGGENVKAAGGEKGKGASVGPCWESLSGSDDKKELKKENQGECAICMDELDSSKNFAKTNCQHSFCLTCLVKALKNNNTCPMCRTNIEDEKPSNTKELCLEEGVELIKEEMDMFNIQEHVEAITMFDSPGGSLKNTLRLFGLGLIKSVIGFQNEEEGEFWENEDSDED